MPGDWLHINTNIETSRVLARIDRRPYGNMCLLDNRSNTTNQYSYAFIWQSMSILQLICSILIQLRTEPYMFLDKVYLTNLTNHCLLCCLVCLYHPFSSNSCDLFAHCLKGSCTGAGSILWGFSMLVGSPLFNVPLKWLLPGKTKSNKAQAVCIIVDM